MTDDLRRVCVAAMRRIQWRLEKQHHRYQERCIEWTEDMDQRVSSDAYDLVEWNLLFDLLSADERRITLDIVVHGHTEQEVAKRLEWSLSRVHRTKMRALAALRRMLDE